MKGKKFEQRMERRDDRGPAKGSRPGKSSLIRTKPRSKKLSEKPDTPRELLLEAGDLPVSYGVTRVVLLPVEPYLVNVYWDISPGDLKKVKHFIAAHSHQPEPVLRFYDVTHSIYGAENAAVFFDVSIDLVAGNWYVHLWSADKAYFVELGLRTTDSGFFPVARSNTAVLPSSRSFSESDERYMLVAGDYDLVKEIPAGTEKNDLSSSLPRGRKHAAGSAPPKTYRMEHLPVPKSAESLNHAAHAPRRRLKSSGLTGITERSFTFGISSGSSDPDRNRGCSPGS
jgi:hypothetical protein